MKKSRSSSNGSGLTQQQQQHQQQGAMEGGAGGAAEGRAGSLSPRRSRRLPIKHDELEATDSDSSANGSTAETVQISASADPPVARHHQHHGGLPFVEHAQQQQHQPPSSNNSCSSSQGNSPLATPTTAVPAVSWSVQQPEVASPGGAQQVVQALIAAQQQQQVSAIRSALVQTQSVDGQACIKSVPAQDGDSCGLWGLLPEELVEIILRQCTATQLGMLESTCHFFRGNKLVEKIAKHKLKMVPRARGLRPNRKDGETYTMLLHYVNCQSAAAAQATSVACGAYHTAALLIPCDSSTSSAPLSPCETSSCDVQGNRHSLYMFGRGFHGQLGTNDFNSHKEPAHVSLGFKPCQDNHDLEEETMPAVVACGAHHTTAISRKGELYSWGLGCNGELGLGRWGPIELSVPRQCSSPSVRIVSVACGANHTLAIAETGTLWSCGKNRHGQLGNSTMVDGSRLQLVMHLTGYRVVSSAAGSAHSMALASDGSLFTWGDGSRGQLGHSQLQGLAVMMPANNPITMPNAQKITRLDPVALSPENRVTAIAAGANHSMALTVGGAILAFGANEHGQLGAGDTLDRWKPTRVRMSQPDEEGRCMRVVQLTCGQNHSIALVSAQGSLQVRTTGCNAHGQLGLGDRVSRACFTHVPQLSNVVAVQAGDEHTAVVTAGGDLYLWGRGDSGQLGHGDNQGKVKPTLLQDFKVVHPDKTLRRNKRSQPFTRPVSVEAKPTEFVGAPCM